MVARLAQGHGGTCSAAEQDGLNASTCDSVTSSTLKVDVTSCNDTLTTATPPSRGTVATIRRVTSASRSSEVIAPGRAGIAISPMSVLAGTRPRRQPLVGRVAEGRLHQLSALVAALTDRDHGNKGWVPAPSLRGRTLG